MYCSESLLLVDDNVLDVQEHLNLALFDRSCFSILKVDSVSVDTLNVFIRKKE